MLPVIKNYNVQSEIGKELEILKKSEAKTAAVNYKKLIK